MSKQMWVYPLILMLLLVQITPAGAATLGPASSYTELLDLLSSARNGDTLLISGKIDAGHQALTTDVNVHIQSADHSAEICGLQIENASVTFKNIQLSDVQISGTSNVLLSSGVHVYGSDGRSALDFRGNGTLIVERGCFVQGGSESSGISIAHSGGDFYSSIVGSVAGGVGKSGGAGMIVSPLGDAGAMMISGSIKGGSGDSLGGHALNLYDLSGNAYVTVDGILQGGSGSIGGDGIQLVSANDNVNVGISGQIRGGSGASYGGSALILMNTADSSSFHLSGSFSGGDALNTDAQPGTSLQLVGDAAVLRARINDCILEDGRKYREPAASAQPLITPLPEIPDAPDGETPAAEATPDPTPSAGLENMPSATPESSVSGAVTDAPDTDTPDTDVPDADAPDTGDAGEPDSDSTEGPADPETETPEEEPTSDGQPAEPEIDADAPVSDNAATEADDLSDGV